MAINIEKITTIVESLENTTSFHEAVDTLLSQERANALELSSASLILASRLADAPEAKYLSSTLGLALGVWALAEESTDGELTWGDLSAVSSTLAALLAKSPVPWAQGASVYFAALAAAPTFGEWLGGKLFDWLNSDIATDFNAAQSFTRRYDPLALDLDGDGIETTGTGNWQNTTLFDHNGDGVAEGTGWLSGDDGWLVRDINGNGAIDNGSELFGDNTVRSDGSTGSDGFSALSDLDNNNDGVIDANDAAFGELKVWRDLNQDGVSQAGELATLSDHGIASIDLASTDVHQNQNGNTIRATSSFTREDGLSSTVGNLDLAKDIGFVEVVQQAEIKVDTFPFTKYGTIAGEVINLSGDAVADEQKGLVYKMRVLMQRSEIAVNGKQVSLSPGMTVTVESKTGTRKMIEFFLSPLLRYSQESARER